MKKYWMLGATAVLALSLAACGDKEKGSTEKAEVEAESTEASADGLDTEQTITYLGKTM